MIDYGFAQAGVSLAFLATIAHADFCRKGAFSTMVFLSICNALYDYAPQAENELELQEGELVYIIEKSDEDDWWKAKKRAPDEGEEEPEGLIPNNYVEEVSQS